jgi:phage shock protein E
MLIFNIMALNLSTLFRALNTIDFRELVDKGAMIIDVRSPSEFSQGHIEGAENWPMTELLEKARNTSKEANLILCCGSGDRAGKAKKILINYGHEQVFNAGSWMSLERILSEELIYNRR